MTLAEPSGTFRTILCFLVPASLVLLSSCRKDPEHPAAQEVVQVPVQLTVNPVWDGAAFDKDTVYAAAGGQRIQVTELKFFLAPLELTGPDATAVMFDADLFNVTNGAEHRSLSVPAGTYHEAHFGLGLPYALNHRDLATIPPNDPTGNNSGMYWSWGTQYRFVIFSGRFDSDPGGTGIPPYTFDLHTGLDTCYRSRSLPLHVDAMEGDTLRLLLTVDIARFFTDGTEVLNLADGAVWHGDPDQLPLVLKAADLQIKAFSAALE